MEAQKSEQYLDHNPMTIARLPKYSRLVVAIAVFVFFGVLVSQVTFAVDFTLQPYGPESFGELINSIIKWVFNLAIPVAVIFILWAGITLLTSSGKPDKVKKGQDMLKYAVIGLVVIFIGKGFISLIKSILELRP